MGVLNGINQDCTHDQNKFTKFLNLSKPSWCLDLKDATDRFPLEIQERILKVITNESISKSWSRILVELPFDFRSEKLTYSKGQGMGAYTSFPMFALSHHVIVKIASRRAGITRFKDYAILGDDIIIQDKQVSDHYKEIMNHLKVDISLTKSYSGNLIEFCKRYFYKGEEFSPYSISSLCSSWKSYPLLLNHIDQMKARGYFLNATQDSLSFIDILYTTMRPWYKTKVLQKCKINNAIKEVFNNKNVNLLRELTELKIDHITDDNIIYIMKHTILIGISDAYISMLMNELRLREKWWTSMKNGKDAGIKIDNDIIKTLSENTPPFLALRTKAARLLNNVSELDNKELRVENLNDEIIEDLSTAFFFEWNIFTMRRNDRKIYTETKLYKIFLELLNKFDPLKLFPKPIGFEITAKDLSKDVRTKKKSHGRTMYLTKRARAYLDPHIKIEQDSKNPKADKVKLEELKAYVKTERFLQNVMKVTNLN